MNTKKVFCLSVCKWHIFLDSISHYHLKGSAMLQIQNKISKVHSACSSHLQPLKKNTNKQKQIHRYLVAFLVCKTQATLVQKECHSRSSSLPSLTLHLQRWHWSEAGTQRSHVQDSLISWSKATNFLSRVSKVKVLPDTWNTEESFNFGIWQRYS